MARTEVDVLVEMLDSAFQRRIPANWSDGWHSLLSNLHSVRDEDWDWLPSDGKRTIHELAAHCGAAMRVYADYGFADGTLMWQDSVPAGWKGWTKGELMPWLIESHDILQDALSACTDGKLDDPRETWDKGDLRPRRWFVMTMIDHLLYHAGEINYIRAMAQKNDE